MTTPYLGEVQLFGFNFNPRGWAFCNGATLPISQNTALFSLLGVQYGGNGQTTFQLPNLAGRAASQQGQGPGLSPRVIGQSFGANTVTLTANQMPAHNHSLFVYSQRDPAKRAGAPSSNGGLSFLSARTTAKSFVGGAVNTTMAPNMIAASQGGGFPHENQQPYLGVNFCIALQGVYPSFP
jgi:microcystin-dependent protein